MLNRQPLITDGGKIHPDEMVTAISFNRGTPRLIYGRFIGLDSGRAVIRVPLQKKTKTVKLSANRVIALGDIVQQCLVNLTEMEMAESFK